MRKPEKRVIRCQAFISREKLEEKAYEAGNGKILVQLYEDFKDGKISRKV